MLHPNPEDFLAPDECNPATRYKEVRQNIVAELEEHNYEVHWEIVNTRTQGIPQSRPRFYLLALQRPVQHAFTFPGRIGCEDIKGYLDQAAFGVRKAVGPQAHDKAVEVARKKGLHVTKGVPIFVDIHASPRFATAMAGCSPCLTASRAPIGGHYIITKKRMMTLPELCRLQGLPPSRVDYRAADVSKRAFLQALGNMMSVNVLMRMLPGLLWAGGFLPEKPVLPSTFRTLLG